MQNMNKIFLDLPELSTLVIGRMRTTCSKMAKILRIMIDVLEDYGRHRAARELRLMGEYQAADNLLRSK